MWWLKAQFVYELHGIAHVFFFSFIILIVKVIFFFSGHQISVVKNKCHLTFVLTFLYIITPEMVTILMNHSWISV